MSIGRIVAGAQMLLTPGLVAPVWLGRQGRKGGARLLMRALGVRDLGIGAGVLATLRSGGSLQVWLLAGILADLTDFGATLYERDSLPASANLVFPLAAGGVALGAYALAGTGSDSA